MNKRTHRLARRASDLLYLERGGSPAANSRATRHGRCSRRLIGAFSGRQEAPLGTAWQAWQHSRHAAPDGAWRVFEERSAINLALLAQLPGGPISTRNGKTQLLGEQIHASFFTRKELSCAQNLNDNLLVGRARQDLSLKRRQTMNAIMQFLQTTFGPLVFLFTVSNLAAMGLQVEGARGCRGVAEQEIPGADLRMGLGLGARSSAI